MELQHHGIRGMKWGVRRFRNYDGSYTKRGLARYDKASDKYEAASKNKKSAKEAYKTGRGSKAEYNKAISDQKTAKHELNKSYDKLKMDNRADKGKKLYQHGKTITGNTTLLSVSQGVTTIGSAFVGKYISAKTGNRKAGALAAAEVFVGGTAINAAIAGKNYVQNRNLRAYYGH